MIELLRAREHLRFVQLELYNIRQIHYIPAQPYERAVLAALSWVWDAQERAAYSKMDYFQGSTRSFETMCMYVQ